MSNTSRARQAQLRRENALWDYTQRACRLAFKEATPMAIYESPWGSLSICSLARWMKLREWRHQLKHPNAPARQGHKLHAIVEPGEAPASVRKRLFGAVPTSLQAELAQRDAQD